jgi:hypothetical protein
MNLQDAINVIESAPGFTDKTTTVGEAWAVVLASLNPAFMPVPVSERPWERDGWCDEQGQCWWFNPGQPAMSNPHIATSSWRLCRMLKGKPMGTNWLPANALPLPSGEAE